MENQDNKQSDEVFAQMHVDTPWFKLFVDEIGWKEVLVVAMILVSIVYIIKG